jgi:ligand-binding sensor domain-containing protein
MQMHAWEIAAYFYAHAGDEKRECTSLVNALVTAQNNNLFITSPNGVQYPYHTPATVQRLAHLMKTPEHKDYVVKWMASSGFDATEQTNFFAELEQLACSYN